MATAEQARLGLGIRFERFALAARYVAYAVLVLVFLLGWVPGSYGDLAVVTAVVLAHNVFVHLVLVSKRYALFGTPWNFAVHLAEATLVVAFTGAEESELYVLYFFLLIGCPAYSRRLSRILGAGFLCLLAYAAVIVVEWQRLGIAVAPGILFIKLASIPVCAWLVATLSQLLRQAEQASQNNARALAASEGALRSVIESTADPTFVLDEHEFILDVNAKACTFLDVERSALIGKRFRVYVFDDGTLAEKFGEVLALNEHHSEQILIDAQGREHTVEFHLRAFFPNQRRTFVVVAHDITEQKDLQEAVQLANARLEHLDRELRQVGEMRADLLRDISKRVRSPVTAVLGYLDMLLAEDLGSLQSGQRHALQSCRRGVTRILRFIDDALGATPQSL